MNEARFPKIFSSKFFLVALAALALIVGFSVSREWYRKHQLQLEYRSLQSEVDKLENKNGEIATLIEYLKNDEGLEKEARRRLNLKKPGESVVVIVPPASSGEKKPSDPAPGESSAAANRTIVEEKYSEESGNANAKKWRDYFFGASTSEN